jgi:hypothetical protein
MLNRILSANGVVDVSEVELSKQPAREREIRTEITRIVFFVIELVSLLSILFVPRIEISLHKACVREAWTEKIL